MNKNKQHIDHLFKEGLDNFEINPSEELWANISNKLPKKKKKRSPLVIFLPVGIAASLLLFFILLYQKDIGKSPKIEIVNLNELDSPCPVDLMDKEDIIQSSTLYTSRSQDSISNESKIKEVIAYKGAEKPAYLSNNKHDRKLSKNTSNLIANNATSIKDIISSKNDNNIQKTDKIIDLKEVATNELKKTVDIEIPLDTLPPIKDENLSELKNRWSILPQLATLDYNPLQGNSTFGNTIANQEYNTTVSYGVKIAYQASTKWSIRTGVNTANFDITTTLENTLDFSSVQSFIDGDKLNIPLNKTPPNVNEEPTTPIFDPNKGFGELDNQDGQGRDNPDARPDETPTNVFSKGNVRQEINYIEIPIEVSYKLLDKRFELALIGGLSSFILTKNQSDISFQNGQSRDFGSQLINVNNTVFSNNIGLGLQYNLTNKLSLNVEPSVKIQWNAFNSQADFLPYIFGLSTGIKIKL